jgi:cellulose synthase/poly-beta-1,6-N-acetylglucosamine synthase-like glycosyltransferase
MIAEIIFFTSITLILYSYIGYPILLFVLSSLFSRRTNCADITPRISLIITARNEEKDIRRKLENALSLDYPRDHYEIIVASDCSDDHTDDIVRSFADQGVILYREERRYGKTITQNRAVKHSTGDILIFSDATTEYENQALRTIVRPFADPQVGCVAGQLVYTDPNATTVGKGCSSYWNYEKLIKHFESRLGSLIGVSGCLYAVRRSCQVRLRDDMIDDFVVASEIRAQGLRTVYEPAAIAFEQTNKGYRDEFKMRVRIVKQTLNAIGRYLTMLNWRENGSFIFQMISHKVMRYLVPFLLLALLVSNYFLVDWNDLSALLHHPLEWLTRSAFWMKGFLLTFIGQCLFYLTALFGYGLNRLGIKPLGPLALPVYFVLVNWAVLVAVMKTTSGENYVVWEPNREAEKATVEPLSSRARVMTN